MTEKTYTAAEVKAMLDKSMKAFQSGMVQIIRECANSSHYNNLSGHDALVLVADKLENLKG